MSLDLGYAVRAILNKLNLPHAEIIGLMMHSTGRDARQNELARVNAYSWLTEFNHFAQTDNSYPGDLSCGFPPHGTGVPTFDHTYLLNLGSNLETADFDLTTRHIAEYIGLNSLSPASAFFHGARAQKTNEDVSGQHGYAPIRSFGLFRHASASNELCDQLSRLTSERLLAKWRIPTLCDGQPDMTREASQLMTRLQLDAAGLAANCRSMIDLSLGSSPGEFVAAWLAERAKKRGANQESLLPEIDRLFGRLEPNECETEFRGQRPADLVAALADKLKTEVRRWLVRHVERPGQRLAGARATLTACQTYLRRVEAELKKIRCAAADRLIQIRAEASAAAFAKPSPSGCGDLTWVDEYFHTRFDHITILGAEHVLRVIEAEGKAISDEFASLGREIEQVAAVLNRSVSSAAGDDDLVPQEKRVAERFDARLDEFAIQVDILLQTEFLDASGGLVKTITQGGRQRAQLTAKLHELSRRVVHQMMSSGTAQNGDEAWHDSSNGLSGAISLATPAVLEYGGHRRIVAVMPIESSPALCSESATQMFGKAVTEVQGADNSLVVCVEADGISLPHFALDIVERRRDRIDFAGRVFSRTDIEWQPLIDTQCVSNVWQIVSDRQADAQNDLGRTMVI